MRSHDDRIRTQEKEFRAVCVDALNLSDHTQQELADLAGVHQCTIARWFSYSVGDAPLPAYILSIIPREVAVQILAFLAHKHGYDVVPVQVNNEALNGHLEDEELDLAAELGRLIDGAKKTDKRKMLRVLERMAILISQARSEIYSMK